MHNSQQYTFFVETCHLSCAQITPEHCNDSKKAQLTQAPEALLTVCAFIQFYWTHSEGARLADLKFLSSSCMTRSNFWLGGNPGK